MVTLIFLYRTSMQLEAFHTNLPSLPWTVHEAFVVLGTRYFVVFCLFDPETSDVEKREVARAIVCTPHPATIQLGKPHMPVLMPANPSLASFVGTDSWKLWELIGVGHAWL